MNNQAESKTSKWLIDIKKKTSSKSIGYFNTNDSLGNQYVIEWEIIDPHSSRLNEKIKNLNDLLIESYSKIELEFAKKFPDAVKNEMFLQTLAPMFEQGIENIDWKSAENQIKNVLQQFFQETDWAKFSNRDDIHLFAVIKEKGTTKSLGMIQFLITSEYDYGSAKIALYDGVMPLEPARELNKVLMSSIFKLIPDVKRLFFHTRLTNENAINEHQRWGFTKFPGNLVNWIDLEYSVEKTDYLQIVSKSLIEEFNSLY